MRFPHGVQLLEASNPPPNPPANQVIEHDEDAFSSTSLPSHHSKSFDAVSTVLKAGVKLIA